jgi:hypothetical protein
MGIPLSATLKVLTLLTEHNHQNIPIRMEAYWKKLMNIHLTSGNNNQTREVASKLLRIRDLFKYDLRIVHGFI